jgi:5-methylcytosine-specific restriction protein B
MTTPDLTSDVGLRAATAAVMQPQSWRTSETGWTNDLAETFDWIRRAGVSERAGRAFQQRLWEENRIAAVGQGNISVDGALEDEGFRRWLAEASLRPLPDDTGARTELLTDLYEELQRRLKPYVTRTPRLKILRVIAALYPEAMTTVADRNALRRTARLLGLSHKLKPIAEHLWIRNRLERALGPVENATLGLARRIALPWILYDRFVLQAPSATPANGTQVHATNPNGSPTPNGLSPLPAARRRRGLTAIKGLFASVMSTLEFIGSNGVTRQELMDFLQASSPDAKEASIRMTVNVLQSELDTIRREGARYLLTDRGAAVLASGTPGPLCDWLLTHILGFDKTLLELRDGPLSTSELIAVIRATNPGLHSNFVPQAMVSWLRSLGVVEADDKSMHQLTEMGRQWADLIHWEPESLPPEPIPLPPGKDGTRDIALPALSSIIGRVQTTGHFPGDLIARLHTSLWSNRRRHFAILTGLSGSGKTLLAREYANAITGGGDSRVLTLPVQPGWYDPGALLGFTNPLRGQSYVGTAFLDFLLEAAGDPERAYVAVLDEMNLSHPEQYMAPLLSTMETGGPIQLHTEGEILDSVPSAIAYPANLVLIGTVNMDETTHGLSDKVLDRAFVIEFWEVDLDAYPRWGARALSTGDEKRTREVLTALMSALAPARLHFGWRVVDDVLDYLEQAAHASDVLSFEAALDSVIYSKVLPKLRGEDAPRFRDALSACDKVLDGFGLDKSKAKVQELRRDVEATGSARFWR